LNWVKGLNARYTDEDYLFVILFGNTDADDMAYRAARSACEKIRQDGAIIDVAMPEISAAELSLTQERLGIQKLPAVLLFASTGQVDVIKGDINETRLLQSYLNMVKTCSPGSGCCGK
jgi:hypothetical protein